MKKYLVTVALLATIGANAESNPFDLQKNLQKIDQDQDVLLSALKEMADTKEQIEEIEAPVAEQLPTPEVVNEAEEANTTNANMEIAMDAKEAEVEINTTTDTSRVDAIREKLMEEEAKKEVAASVDQNHKSEEIKKLEMQQIAMQKAEEERIEKVKAEQKKIEQARIEQRKIEEERAAEMQAQKVAEEQERLATKKAEEERLEVEAYEAKRLAKKQAEEKLAAETKAAEEMKKQKHEVVDINITREELVAKQEADKEYLDAVKEMDSED